MEVPQQNQVSIEIKRIEVQCAVLYKNDKQNTNLLVKPHSKDSLAAKDSKKHNYMMLSSKIIKADD